METIVETIIESKYCTKDFNLAAFLWSYKYNAGAAELLSTTPTPEGKRVVLYFQFILPLTQEDTESLMLQYLNGNCIVEPLAFIECQGKLKDIIHTRRN